MTAILSVGSSPRCVPFAIPRCRRPPCLSCDSHSDMLARSCGGVARMGEDDVPRAAPAKRVQFDKSVDIQKEELRKERAAKQAEVRRFEAKDNNHYLFDNDSFSRTSNPPPFSTSSCFLLDREDPFDDWAPVVDRLQSGDNSPPRFFVSSDRYGPVGSGRPRRRNDFAESEGTRRRFTDSYKTALCNEWREYQKCSYGEDCRYAHGINELRLPAQANPHYKTILCRNFTNLGHCPHGARCKFVHRRERAHNQFASSLLAMSFSMFNRSQGK